VNLMEDRVSECFRIMDSEKPYDYQSASIMGLVKFRRLLWAGHVGGITR